MVLSLLLRSTLEASDGCFTGFKPTLPLHQGRLHLKIILVIYIIYRFSQWNVWRNLVRLVLLGNIQRSVSKPIQCSSYQLSFLYYYLSAFIKACKGYEQKSSDESIIIIQNSKHLLRAILLIQYMFIMQRDYLFLKLPKSLKI